MFRHLVTIHTSGAHRLMFSTTTSCLLKKRFKNIFTTKATQQQIKSDGFGANFSLIYKEPSDFKSHRNLFLIGSSFAITIYLLGQRAWPTSTFFGSALGPAVLLSYLGLFSAYNLRLFYRIPRRLYFNPFNKTYTILLNQVVPWRKPVVVNFLQKDIKQVLTVGVDGAVRSYSSLRHSGLSDVHRVVTCSRQIGRYVL